MQNAQRGNMRGNVVLEWPRAIQDTIERCFKNVGKG